MLCIEYWSIFLYSVFFPISIRSFHIERYILFHWKIIKIDFIQLKMLKNLNFILFLIDFPNFTKAYWNWKLMKAYFDDMTEIDHISLLYFNKNTYFLKYFYYFFFINKSYHFRLLLKCHHNNPTDALIVALFILPRHARVNQSILKLFLAQWKQKL